jgi:hypothetical protein
MQRRKRRCPAIHRIAGGRARPFHFRYVTDRFRAQFDRRRKKPTARVYASVPSFGLCDGLPDLGATVGALIDEVDLGHAPMRLDVSHKHRKQPDTSRTDDRRGLNIVMLDVGWHVGSPS